MLVDLERVNRESGRPRIDDRYDAEGNEGCLVCMRSDGLENLTDSWVIERSGCEALWG